MADATIDTNRDISIQRITAGPIASRPAYYKGAPNALHIATATPYGVSFFDGGAGTWQNLFLGSAP